MAHTLFWTRVIILSMIPAAFPILATESRCAERIPVEVWRVGEDGPTTRLRDALEIAFES